MVTQRPAEIDAIILSPLHTVLTCAKSNAKVMRHRADHQVDDFRRQAGELEAGNALPLTETGDVRPRSMTASPMSSAYPTIHSSASGVIVFHRGAWQSR
jgi:hypothetical protein